MLVKLERLKEVYWNLIIPQCPIKTLNLISSSFAEITHFKINLKLAQPIPKVGLQCECYATPRLRDQTVMTTRLTC